ncbi:MAG: GIY-YIG nuclease family protein [Ignavibacteria bacterium]|nr:GIY-YIG nuclease family protein [Ignavibacteria bacterium]
MLDLLTPLDEVRFVVVDIESTGGTSGDHRIIEIAFCVIENGEIVGRYESLINPHERIPDFISVMTGITNEMVSTAPDEDVAMLPLLRELSDEHSVFVAHNVGFDWGFVAKTLLRCGHEVPDIHRLCTVKLSRRLSTGLAKHDLASVAEFYNVVINARHRAMGDTEATAFVLKSLLQRCIDEFEATTIGDIVNLQYAPRKTTKTISKSKDAVKQYLDELPDEPGVYYFLNAKNQILYVGKAKSLVKRVKSYFSESPLHGKNVQKMVRFIRKIKWQTTGTELGAMLLESREIKQILPGYNVASREYHAPTFLRITNEDYPRLELVHRVNDDGSEYFGPFRSERMAEKILDMIVFEYKIRRCEGDLQPNPAARPCFDYHIKRCLAPCNESQSMADYRTAVLDARKYLANVEKGAIAKLRDSMMAASDALEYERAATLRNGIREIERVTLHSADTPLAVSDTNVVIVIPTNDRVSAVEVYAMRAGRLRMQRIVGCSAVLDALFVDVQDVYVQPEPTGSFTDRELDELRIITTFLHQRRARATTVVIENTFTELHLSKLTMAIRAA